MLNTANIVGASRSALLDGHLAHMMPGRVGYGLCREEVVELTKSWRAAFPK
jgi:hypothetical protein